MNHVVNTVPKDDPPEPPKNILYLVTFGASNPHKISLKMRFSSGENPTNWLCAAFVGVGDKVPQSDTRFNNEGIAEMQFPHYPAQIPYYGGLQSAEYRLMIAKDIHNNGQLDEAHASLVRIRTLANSTAKVQAYSPLDYAYAWGIIVIGSQGETGWWLDKPFTVRLLRIFKDGSSANLESQYQPSTVRNVAMNCLQNDSPFVKWLTHNAGATFAPDGHVELKEYVWDDDTAFSSFVASAPQFDATEQAFFWSNFGTQILPDWDSLPTGYSAWLPSATGWYTLVGPNNPQTVTLGDSSGGGDDLYTAFARVRLTRHKVRFHVKKIAPGTVPVIDGYRRTGVIADLYDFNITAASPAEEAAVVQLGYGNGTADAPGGKIYRSRFFFKKNWGP